MATNALVQTCIDGAVKDEAAAVLKGIGLTVSDAVRLMLVRVAREKTLPFDVRTPTQQPARRSPSWSRAKGPASKMWLR